MEGGSRLGAPWKWVGFWEWILCWTLLSSFSVIFFLVDCFGRTVVDGGNGLEEDDK